MLAPAVTGILARALGDPDPLPEGTEQPLARTAAGLAVVGVLLGGVLAVTQTPVLDPDIPQDLLGLAVHGRRVDESAPTRCEGGKDLF